MKSTITLPYQQVNKRSAIERFKALCVLLLICTLSLCFAVPVQANPLRSQKINTELTPLQREIERQRQRLSASDVEERRDAVMRLGWMKRAESSRAALVALNDSTEIVRATAAHAVLSLPPDEAATFLLPLLQDKKEFVRQEAAYALGSTRSRLAVSALIASLISDKAASVRGAAAVALGEIADEAAVIPLAETIDRSISANGSANRLRRSKAEKNVYVQRAAARALGQIGSRKGVPALIAALSNVKADDDMRREAARSLGLIGDVAAIQSLRVALGAHDPYLSRLAHEALQKIASADTLR